jgi:hypothetical protein
MKGVIYLIINEVYFYAGFLDRDLTIPSIETWIYEGKDPEDGHTFHDAADKTKKYCFPNGITSNILDRKTLSEWILDKHSPNQPGKEYVYKNL